MNIMISINRKYIPYACVMLMSLKAHHRNTALSVYILHHELTEDDFLRMDEVIGPEGIALIPVYIPEGTTKDFCIGSWPEENAYRLLAADLFAGSMDRILHLDADILITGDIQEFYDTSFDGNYLAACDDFLTEEQRRNKCRQFGKDENARFFNAGVMLFNLDRLAEDGFCYSVYADIRKRYPAIRIEYPDQDMLNLLFNDKTRYLERDRYNYAPYFYQTSVADRYYNTREELESHCSILHMICGSKPWENMIRMAANELWWEYAARTPYYDGMKAYHVRALLDKERQLNDMIRDKVGRSAGARAEEASEVSAMLEKIYGSAQDFADRIKKIKKF